MSYINLLQKLGFEADPFAKTNADEEERLDRYFVPPPFFNAVFGDINHPKSAVVFAPRGGGKTALKRRIELKSMEQPFLCCTYNTFEITGKQLEDIDLNYHLVNVVRRVLTGVLLAVQKGGVEGISNEDRHLLYLLAKQHLAKLGQSEMKTTLESVKTFGDSAKEWWNAFTGPIGVVLNGLLQKIGFPDAQISKFESDGGVLGSLNDQLGFLRRIASICGYKSIYVLVDRIDENALTNASGNNSFRFISPLLTDLQTLELEGLCFKFFLWDLLLEDYRAVARPDRVKYYTLAWTSEQLEQMLASRINAYSNGAVSDLRQICPLKGPWSLDRLVCLLAQGSPRTLIRIGKAILDQQSELDASSPELSQTAVNQGMAEIAKNISEEHFKSGVLRDLQRCKRCDFTIKHVAAAFKISAPGAVNKVRGWEDSGAVFSLGTIQEQSGVKPSNHYGLSNLLLAKHLNSDLTVTAFAQAKIVVCPSCKTSLVRDWDIPNQTCSNCQVDVVGPV